MTPPTENDDSDEQKRTFGTGGYGRGSFGPSSEETDPETPAPEPEPEPEPEPKPEPEPETPKPPAPGPGPEPDGGEGGTAPSSGDIPVGQGNPVERIQEAFDLADDGDEIVVTGSYDATAAGETFPIVIDRTKKQVTLRGTDASGAEINGGDTAEPLVILRGPGASDRRNTPAVRDLKFVGGTHHLKLEGAPGLMGFNTRHLRSTSHAISLESSPDGSINSHSTTWIGCTAWSCGGAGFYCAPEGGTHATTFIACTSSWNGWNHSGTSPKPGVELRGNGSTWRHGTTQRNAGYGVHARDADSLTVADSYFESNGLEAEHPIQAFARNGRNHTIENCHFNGTMYPGNRHMTNVKGHSRAHRAATFHAVKTGEIRGCRSENHEHGLVTVQGASEDVDLNLHTHSAEANLVVRDVGARTRSGGVMLPQDLSTVNGTFPGDRGIDTRTGLIGVWHGDRWHFRSAGSSDGDGSEPAAPSPPTTGVTRTQQILMRGTNEQTILTKIEAPTDGPTTFVVGGMHGDELSGRIAAETIEQWTPRSGTLLVLPRANVPAIDARSRSAGYDLNRSFPRGSEPTRPLAREIWNVITREQPDLIIDLHSSIGYRADGTGVGQAVYPAASGNSGTLAYACRDRLNEKFGFSGIHRYVMGNTLTGVNPMLIHKVAADYGRTGLLAETARKSGSNEVQAQWHVATVVRALQWIGHDLPSAIRGLG